MTRTSIVIVGYKHRAHLPDCFEALGRAGLDPATTRVLFVDNASGDGSAELVEEVLAPRAGVPVEVLRSEQNLGFAGGNNLAIARAQADGDAYVYLLNPDTQVEPGFLAEALAAAADPRIALVQSLVLRAGEPPTVNTLGNAFHFLGFGYAAGDGQRLDSPEVAQILRDVREVAVASGAAVLARLSVLAEIGPFEEELFLYHEDAELSLRARAAGYRVVLAPASRVRHHYDFARNPRKLYWLERNRWLVLAWHLDARTLAALLPALVGVEAGLLLLAAKQGWLQEKVDAYRYFGSLAHLREIGRTRRRLRGLRRIGDDELTAAFVDQIRFPAVDSWLLRRVANPMLSWYWAGTRRLLGF